MTVSGSSVQRDIILTVSGKTMIQCRNQSYKQNAAAINKFRHIHKIIKPIRSSNVYISSYKVPINITVGT